ncbi:MAG: glycosyltransferase family 4 protein [Chloroflexi bacterium]|nr:glycosyltransferase family 4 protein [Chloroflexota bacterium]
MHLAINATEIGRQRGGNESYLRGLVEGLLSLATQVRVTLLATPTGADWCAERAGATSSIVDIGPYRRVPFHFWQQAAILRRVKPDWYLSTFFLPPVISCRAAVLVHDMSFRAHPEYFPSHIAWYMRILTGAAIRRADRVIALSQFTEREVLRFHPEAQHRTVVVYPGVGAEFALTDDDEVDQRVLDRMGIPSGYIFALGNIHPRKNLSRLLDAYLALKSGGEAVPPMLWAGLPRWDSGHLLQRARSAGVILPGFVPQEDLPAIYRQAAMMVYPSIYEGFGLPPLEAMACGTPVIVSDTTSLPEAVGDAALLVDPTDAQAIGAAITQILRDDSLRLRLRRAGLERARDLTWARTARLLLSSL